MSKNLLNTKVCAVVLSGGSGTRFGAEGGKQLLSVAGRPLMSWCIEAFDKAQSISHIVVVCPQDDTDLIKREAVEPFGITTPVSFAPAGDTRQASELSGVNAAPAECAYVAIHDGARPLITSEQVDAAVALLVQDAGLDGVVFGQPSVDTLKIVAEDGSIESTPDRARYWTVQTPQIFKRDVMIAAQESAAKEGFLGTDDSSLVEHMGGCVKCIETPRDNLKLTVPEDLPVIEALIRKRLEA